jgi:hypothetical protein
MKKLNFIRTGIVMSLLLCCNLIANAQSQSPLTFTQAMDSLLAPLDKSRIPTGILYERVEPFANIDLFNISSPDPFISEYSFFCQTYFELYNAAYNRSSWLKPDYLKAWAEGEALQGKYTVGVLDYQFNMIDSNAVNNGLLTYSNGQFHDVPGAANPYWAKRLQMAAILGDELPGGQVSIVYNPDFVKTNQSLSISSIQLNFGTMGVYSLSPANPVAQINFTGSGVKEFNITVQYSNGSSFNHASEVQIGGSTEPYANRVEGPVAELPDATFWISSKYPFKGYEESQPYYAKAKISIWWKRDANNIPVPGIKKPVIIVDGFDPKGERKDTSIYKLFQYVTQNNFPENFADELRSFGKDFDIIVMDMPAYTRNFPGTINDPASSLPYPKALYDDVAPDTLKGVIFGGGDYQERNAYVLEALIDSCNHAMLINGSNEKLVVIGPSMGGQITRYALRDMEKTGQNHNCRLWVSFDSNNEGSYAPVGIQYSLNELAIKSHEAAFFKGVYLDCPEAKQSLLHHYLAFSETVRGAPGFFDRYYNEVNNPSFGFPQATGLRKIVMISGSDLGVPQTFGTACQLATSVEAKYRPRGLLAYALTIIPIGPIFFAISPGQTHYTHLAPATGSCNIFEFFQPFAPNYNRKIYAPSWCNTSLDMVQGGHFPSFKVYKAELDGKRPKKWYKNLAKLYVNDFIGSQVQQLTYSTLAIGLGTMPNLNRKWDENFRKDVNGLPMDVTCPETKESPFDMYWGPDINTRHDSLLLGHVVRLRKEIIEKLPWPRTQIQRTPAITGNKTNICRGETVNLTLQNPLPGLNYQWRTSNNFLTITSGQGTANVIASLSPSSNINGAVSVICEASSPCYNIVSQQYTLTTGKIAIVGTYTAPGNSSQPLVPTLIRQPPIWNDACSATYLTTNMIVPVGSSLSWEVYPDVPGTIVWYQTGNNLHFYFMDIDQTGIFAARNTNCGIPNLARFYIRSINSNLCPGQLKPVVSSDLVKVYPNPSSGIVQITLQVVNSKTEIQKSIYEIRIIDKMGIIKYQHQYMKGTQSVIVDIRDLSLDVYTVLVFDGEKWKATKLIKE